MCVTLDIQSRHARAHSAENLVRDCTDDLRELLSADFFVALTADEDDFIAEIDPMPCA